MSSSTLILKEFGLEILRNMLKEIDETF